MSKAADRGKAQREELDTRMMVMPYFLIGIVLLVAGSAVLGWSALAYSDLKKAESEYRELPHNTLGSSNPYPADDLFPVRIGIMAVLFSVGSAFMIKWKTAIKYDKPI